jgi:hypothetical protein
VSEAKEVKEDNISVKVLEGERHYSFSIYINGKRIEGNPFSGDSEVNVFNELERTINELNEDAKGLYLAVEHWKVRKIADMIAEQAARIVGLARVLERIKVETVWPECPECNN